AATRSTASVRAVITVAVNEGASQNKSMSRSFMVTVNPVNEPTSLEPISDLTINEDAGLQTIALSGITSGTTDENQTLTVRAVSGNPALIPDPAVNYASPKSSARLGFSPLPNANGSAVITVIIDDGAGLSNIT